MADIWMDVDVALAEVPVNLFPLTDDTDFKSREVAIAYDAAGMDLVWNFVTTAGAMSQTAVTPTTGGAYDWAHQGDGMYSIEIPANGGATINNDTEGFGWFSGFCTGVLPWRGPIIGFRAAALNNALIDGGDVLDVSVTEIGGVAQSATDLKDLADIGYDPSTHKVQGVVLVDTTTTNTDMRGTNLAALASAYTADRAAKLDEITASRMGALTDWINGGRLDLILDAIKAVTDAIPNGGALTALLASIASILEDTGTTLPAQIATAQNDLDILTGADGANIATAQTFDTLSFTSIMELLIAMAAGNVVKTVDGTDIVLTFKKQDGATTKMVFTVDTDGNRTVVVS